jgi:hypothetical protein
MSSPVGDYSFAGLGFTSLQFSLEGSQYVGSLSYGDSSIAISGATYTDATGVVTFSAGESPGGVADLNFTGNLILDLSGDVIAIAGTWTGRSFIHTPAAAAPAASAHAEPAIRKGIGPNIPILQAHGAWAAFNRQNSI